MSEFNTVLELAIWGVFIAIALQVIFYFVFQVIGYDSYLLSMTLIISCVIAVLVIVGWEILKRTAKTLTKQ